VGLDATSSKPASIDYHISKTTSQYQPRGYLSGLTKFIPDFIVYGLYRPPYIRQGIMYNFFMMPPKTSINSDANFEGWFGCTQIHGNSYGLGEIEVELKLNFISIAHKPCGLG
jgi:hypothetical protein